MKFTSKPAADKIRNTANCLADKEPWATRKGADGNRYRHRCSLKIRQHHAARKKEISAELKPVAMERSIRSRWSCSSRSDRRCTGPSRWVQWVPGRTHRRHNMAVMSRSSLVASNTRFHGLKVNNSTEYPPLLILYAWGH